MADFVTAPLPFFVPITKNFPQNDWFEALGSVAENTFNLGGRQVKVLQPLPGIKGLPVKYRKRNTQNWFTTALKVLSYATLIFPLFMLGIKFVCRTKYKPVIVEKKIEPPLQANPKVQPVQVIPTIPNQKIAVPQPNSNPAPTAAVLPTTPNVNPAPGPTSHSLPNPVNTTAPSIVQPELMTSNESSSAPAALPTPSNVQTASAQPVVPSLSSTNTLDSPPTPAAQPADSVPSSQAQKSALEIKLDTLLNSLSAVPADTTASNNQPDADLTALKAFAETLPSGNIISPVDSDTDSSSVNSATDSSTDGSDTDSDIDMDDLIERDHHDLDYKLATRLDIIQTKVIREISLDTVKPAKKIHQKNFSTETEKHYVGPYELNVARSPGVAYGYMEDRHCALEFTFLAKDQITRTAQMFGVFDGHGGTACAEFLRRQLFKFIKAELESKTSLSDLDIWNALKIAFVKANDYYIMNEDVDEPAGSTGTILLMIEGGLWTANVGDSRAVLSRNGQAVQLSKDQKADDTAFLRSIEKRDGYVEDQRVNGMLMVARAFGDQFITGLTARPKIHKEPLAALSNNDFILLASDGLWDTVGSQEAVEVAAQTPFEQLPKTLISTAVSRGSKDNITVVVVKPT